MSQPTVKVDKTDDDKKTLASRKMKYVMVEEETPPSSPKVEDTKVIPAPPKMGAPSAGSLSERAMMHRLMQRGMRKKAGGKNASWNYQSFRANTVFRITNAGTAATFFNLTVNLTPNNSSLVTEAAQLAILFDEQRCCGITVHCRMSSQLQVIDGAWALVYDVANSGAYTSVAGALIAGQVLGPQSFNFGFGTVPQTKSGYTVKRFRPPTMISATAGSSPANESVGGAWFSSSDQNASVGYLKFAGDPIAGGALQADCFVIFHMEYRERT